MYLLRLLQRRARLAEVGEVVHLLPEVIVGLGGYRANDENKGYNKQNAHDWVFALKMHKVQGIHNSFSKNDRQRFVATGERELRAMIHQSDCRRSSYGSSRSLRLTINFP